MRTDTGYSFLFLGGLYQNIVDTTIEACRRFGADRAMSVISTAIYPSSTVPLTLESLRQEILEETGITATDDDISFLGKIAEANMLIREAAKLLNDAHRGLT